MHEVAADVHLQHPAGLLPVLALATDMLFQAVYAVVRAAPLDAGIAVLDEGPFQQLVRIIIIKVVHDAVAEVGGKHLALLRVGDEGLTPFRFCPCRANNKKDTAGRCPSCVILLRLTLS